MKVTAALAFVGTAAAAQYATWNSPNGIQYGVSIPDVAAAPFDVALKIVAPKAVGWAGISWGGSMLNVPLTVAWPSGTNVMVSSRTATGYMMPRAFDGLSFRPGPDSTVNTTHWVLNVICTGCSKWASGSLNPSAAAAPLAWAFSSRAPATPASNTSNFGIHDNKGRFSLDLTKAKSADFATAFAPPA